MATANTGKSPLDRAVHNYWREARRPLAALAMVFVLLVIYEGGVAILGSYSVRSGADQWLRDQLAFVGFGEALLVPALLLFVLLCWHQMRRERMRLSAGTVAGMFLESAMWAGALVVAVEIHCFLWLSDPAPLATYAPGESPGMGRSGDASAAVAHVGAGIYEEAIFRLGILSVLLLLVRRLFGDEPRHLIAATLAGAAAFALLDSYALGWTTLAPSDVSLRFLAGVVFGWIFVKRGFGIAVGTHAAYDVWMGLT